MTKILNFPNTIVLSDIIKEYALTTPDKVAINDGIKKYTFAQLETYSDHIASKFIVMGLKPNDRVCIIAHKCSEIIPLAIGIWKCGGIYTPLDPELSDERLNKIIQNIEPLIIVGNTEEKQKLDLFNIKYVLDFDIVTSPEVTCVTAFPSFTPDDNAIIIHTSGSTGLPKGVVLQHKSVITYFNGHRHFLGINNDSRCMNTSSFHYDVSIQDTFQPLYFGAYVYLYKHFFIPQLVLPLIIKEKFTLVTAISTILNLITGDLENLDKYKFPDLKYISFGAEVCSINLINKWLKNNPGLTMVNGYGPSECNSVSISYPISSPDENRKTYFPIGKAHSTVDIVLYCNNSDEIVSESDKDGEILIGGDQMMNYYWNNEDATIAAFKYIKNKKYYRTGDIAYYNIDFDLVYKSRRDFEIKYNGRRINMHEITSIVQTGCGFKYVDCHYFESNIDKYLILIVQVDDYDNIKNLTSEIFYILRKSLTSHSIPNVICFYSGNIQLSSGKINRKKLIGEINEALNIEPSDIYIYKSETFVPYKKVLNEV